MPRVLALLLGTLLLTAEAPNPSAPTLSLEPQVIAQIAQHNAPIEHFTFDVTAHIALLTFPWIRFSLHGHGTYTRGGEYVVHFDDVPWFGKGYDTMPMGALDVTTWPALYTMSVASSQGTLTTLSMHDVKKSNMVEARAKLDAEQGLEQILWTYDYGGRVKLTVTPQQVDGFYFPGAEEAEIVMPNYRAMAWATFSNYQVVAARTPQPSNVTGTK
jgi:hypothetical protein